MQKITVEDTLADPTNARGKVAFIVHIMEDLGANCRGWLLELTSEVLLAPSVVGWRVRWFIGEKERIIDEINQR